jgi:WD40 repeat protein
VIDAIDECTKYREFFTLIRGVQLHFPLRIFMTSRKIPDLNRIHRTLEASSASAVCIEIPTEDNIEDIKCYIQMRVEHLALDAIAERNELADAILQRSNACFLWVRLVLDELEKVYSKESILEVLQNIPAGMIPYYERTARAMTDNKREKHIAKAILRWVIASARSLTVPELSQALKIDIKTVLPNPKLAIEGLCGQLVSVHSHTGVVELVHPTAREFLLSEAAGEFCVTKHYAHERVALSCLQILTGSEMKAPRNPRLVAKTALDRRKESSPLLKYALYNLFEHIYTAPAESDDVLFALDRFFRTNVLGWIESIAQRGDLYPIIRASKNLKGYLDRRAKDRSPSSRQMRNIDSWSTDLSRLVTKFGPALLRSPSSIYFLIPPLCPTESAIYQQFAKRPDGLAVVGYNECTWNDCVASVGFGEDSRAAAISCSDSLIAVGMLSGDINVYSQRSCQKQSVIQQQHPVDLVHFTDKSIAACTTKSIVLMALNGTVIWRTPLRFRCILLASSTNSIIAMTQHGHCLKFDISDGTLLEDQNLEYRRPEHDEGHDISTKAPFAASLSADLEMLALAYTWGTVCLWDVESGELVAWAQDEASRLAEVLLFNPIPDVNRLLVISTDHTLAIYDTWSGGLLKSRTTPSYAGVLSASGSLDGRTVATMDMRGGLRLWDFESLSLLYHVLSPTTSFSVLKFASDNSSIIDVVDTGMRVWSPAALVRKNDEEDESGSGDAIDIAAAQGDYESLRCSKITALCVHPTSPIAFAGKHNGQVIAYNAKTGSQIAVIYTHAHGSFVTNLKVSKKNIIASSDADGIVQVWNLGSDEPSILSQGPSLVRTISGAQVRQLCFSGCGDYLMISTETTDQVYSIPLNSCIGSLSFGPQDRNVWMWASFSSSGEEEQFMLIQDHVLKKFSVAGFPSRADDCEIHLAYEFEEVGREVKIDATAIDSQSQTLFLEVQHITGFASSSTTFIFDLREVPPDSTSVTLSALDNLLTRCCKNFIGFRERTRSVLFLHQNSWLCSTELTALGDDRYSEHFYVPAEYQSAEQQIRLWRAANDTIVFCLYGEVVFVKNGLNFEVARTLKDA